MIRSAVGAMGRWRTALSALALLGACSAPQRQSPDPFTATGELIALSGGHGGAVSACFTCHGLDGAGNGAGAPRLAGLDIGYLSRQLDDYAIGRRQHPEMQFIARRLGARERQAVAAFYAGMAPAAAGSGAPPPPHPLFHGGDPARGLPPCAACHGPAGEGNGPGFPPLAGQPAAYLAAQLENWRAGRRRNDPLDLMQRISRRLTPDEIRSVAAYASALRPAAPRRESPEAFPAARRDGSRNDASAPPPREPE